MIEVNSGMTSTGIRPRAQAGTLQPAIQCAISPATTPPMMAPRKPVTGAAGVADMPSRVLDVEDVRCQAAHDEAGRDARPVGDGVGDVARQGWDEEHERRLADDEEQGAEVGQQAGAEQRVVEAEGVDGRGGRTASC